MSGVKKMTQQLRTHFPFFAANPETVFLDSAASAQKPQSVMTAMNKAMVNYANVHRGLYGLSQSMTARYEAARQTVANFIHAKPAEIIFTRNATEAINLVAASWGSANLKQGDEIVLTALEHHANIVPWQLIAEKTGALIRVVPINDKGEITIEAVEKTITTRTKIIAFSHMSNVLGTILPVAEMCALAKAHGIVTLVDGCQGVVHDHRMMSELGCDFYAFSGHKLYGPTGIGVLFGREEVLNAMPPFMGGGDMIDTVTFEKSTFKTTPSRFEAGTPNFIEAIGLAAAIDFITSNNPAILHEAEQDVYHSLYARLKAVTGVRVYGAADKRGAVVSFACEWGHVSDIAVLLDKQGIAVRSGHHCAMPLIKSFGVTGLLRASVGLYTTHEEIDLLLAGLAKAKRMLA